MVFCIISWKKSIFLSTKLLISCGVDVDCGNGKWTNIILSFGGCGGGGIILPFIFYTLYIDILYY